MVTQKHYFTELLRWHSGKRIHLLRQEMQIRSLGEEDAPRGGRAWQPNPAFLLGKFHGQRATIHGVPRSQTHS